MLSKAFGNGAPVHRGQFYFELYLLWQVVHLENQRTRKSLVKTGNHEQSSSYLADFLPGVFE